MAQTHPINDKVAPERGHWQVGEKGGDCRPDVLGGRLYQPTEFVVVAINELGGA